MFDASRKENESAFLQVKSLARAMKCDCTLDHEEHLVFRGVAVVRRLFTLVRHLFENGVTTARLRFTGLYNKVYANIDAVTLVLF